MAKETDIYELLARHLKKWHVDLLWRFDSSGINNPSPRSRALYSRINASRGYPDLFIARPRLKPQSVDSYAGMFLEIKAEGYRPSKNKQHDAEQRAVIGKLVDEGYYAAMAVGYDNALYCIHQYLGEPCTGDTPEEGFEF